jgi:hypothetical protein
VFARDEKNKKYAFFSFSYRMKRTNVCCFDSNLSQIEVEHEHMLTAELRLFFQLNISIEKEMKLVIYLRAEYRSNL